MKKRNEHEEIKCYAKLKWTENRPFCGRKTEEFPRFIENPEVLRSGLKLRLGKINKLRGKCGRFFFLTFCGVCLIK